VLASFVVVVVVVVDAVGLVEIVVIAALCYSDFSFSY
jgi:hypothetical protein